MRNLSLFFLCFGALVSIGFSYGEDVMEDPMLYPVDPNIIYPDIDDEDSGEPTEVVTGMTSKVSSPTPTTSTGTPHAPTTSEKTSSTPAPPKRTYPSINDIEEPQYLPQNFKATLDRHTCDKKTANIRSASVRVSWSAPQNKSVRVDRYAVRVRDFLDGFDYGFVRDGGQKVYQVFEDLRCGVLYIFTVQAQYEVERKSVTGKTNVVFAETPVQVATVYTGPSHDAYAPRNLKAKVVHADCRTKSWTRTASVMVTWSPPQNTSFPVLSYVAKAVNVDGGTQDKWIIIRNDSAAKQGFEGFQCGATYVITLQAKYLVRYTSALTGEIGEYTFDSSPGVVNVSIKDDEEVTTPAYASTTVPTKARTTSRQTTTPFRTTLTSNVTRTQVTQRATSPTPGHETSEQPQPSVTTTPEAVSVTTEAATSSSAGAPEPPHKDEIKTKESGMSTSKILMMVLIPLALIALGIAGFFAYKKVQRDREEGILSNNDTSP